MYILCRYIIGGFFSRRRNEIRFRLTFLGHRKQMAAAVRQMIAWEPERIIIAHGRCYEGNAVAELRRAFRWLPGV
jgi:hypothetical protein